LYSLGTIIDDCIAFATVACLIVIFFNLDIYFIPFATVACLRYKEDSSYKSKRF